MLTLTGSAVQGGRQTTIKNNHSSIMQNMKASSVTMSLLVSAMLSQAAIVEFDISPTGTTAGIGLSPSNHLHAVTNSAGSGNEILRGISFDTDTMLLYLAFGYGSIANFTDLSGSATAIQMHGPADASMTADVLADLLPLNVPAYNPDQGGIVFGAVQLDDQTSSNLLAGLTYINIYTVANPDGELRGQLLIPAQRPPTITPMDPLVLECAAEDGPSGTLTVEVSDPDNDSLSIVWTVDGTPLQTNLIAVGESAAGVSLQFQAVYGLGSHEVVATVTDDSGETATSMTTVTVNDTTPPDILSITADPNALWPPNHRLVWVRIQVRATDTCGPISAKIKSVRSNELPNGQGDGNTRPDFARADRSNTSDWRIVGPLRLLLRAERSGQGSGRVYTVEVEVKDEAGNVSLGTVEISVAHDGGSGKNR